MSRSDGERVYRKLRGEWYAEATVLTGEYWFFDNTLYKALADSTGDQPPSANWQTAAEPVTESGELKQPHYEYDWNTTGFERYREQWDGKLHWHNDTAQQQGYYGAARRRTLQPLAPSISSQPRWLYPDAPAWTSNSGNATTLYLGTRFTATIAGQALDLRFWIDQTSTDYWYSAMLVRDPLGVADKLQTAWVQSDVAGWAEVGIPNTPIGIGDVFDLVLLIQNRAGEVETTAPWNLSVPQTQESALPGQAVEAILSPTCDFHNIDSDATNQSALLATVKAGDTVTANNVTRTVESNTQNGNQWDIGFVGGNKFSFNGISSLPFTFRVQPTASTTYAELAGQWTGNPNAKGFIQLGAYDPAAAVLTDTGYGVDIRFQDAVFSDDWDLLAFYGSSTRREVQLPPSLPQAIRLVQDWVVQNFGFAAYAAMFDNDFAIASLGAAWTPIDNYGGESYAPRLITTDLVAGTLTFSVDSVYRASITIAFEHDESNQGRTTQVRLWNVTKGVSEGEATIGIGRNQSATFFFTSFGWEITEANKGDAYRIEIGGGDSITIVGTVTTAFEAEAIGEYREPPPAVLGS